MATRGYENFTMTDVAKLGAKAQPAVKKSKYRNVKTQSRDGLVFDSKREADYWWTLKARLSLGEIKDLQRQVKFSLFCPVQWSDTSQEVCYYLADFVYTDVTTDIRHVVDAKGMRTQMYKLKKKWLEMQEQIVIEEV